MKMLLHVVALLLASCGGRTPHGSSDQMHRAKAKNESPSLQWKGLPRDANLDSEKNSRAPRLTFKVEANGASFTVKSDGFDMVSVVDYPRMWRSQAFVSRIDFPPPPDKQPFSKEHCHEIERMAKNGSGDLVRSSFHSMIEFEIPPFIATGFESQIRKSAQEAGIKAPLVTLKNPVDRVHGELEFEMFDEAISANIGAFSHIHEQLNLSQRGIMIDANHKKVLVTSGDVICDLLRGDIVMKMIYPITGNNENVVVVYQPFSIRFREL